MTVPPHVSFTQYAFPVTGGTARRTLPDRLSDVVNVLDWGADPTYSSDSTAAIRAAIAYGASVGNHTVYFPPGNYLIGDPPLSMGQGPGAMMWFVGAGKDATRLRGNYSSSTSREGSYLVQRTGPYDRIWGMTVQNDSVLPYTGAFLDPWGADYLDEAVDCRFVGIIAYEVSWGWITYDYPNHWGSVTYGHGIRNCEFICSAAIPRADAASYLPPAGSTGVGTGCGRMSGCIVKGFDVGIALAGYGLAVFGNHISQCNVGIDMQQDYRRSGLSYMSGCSVFSNVIERCNTGLYFRGLGGTYAAANAIIGNGGVPNSAPIQNMSWNAATHVVTVQTPAAHNIAGPTATIWLDQVNPSAWTPDGSGTQRVTATITDATHFAYAGPSAQPPTFVSGSWNRALTGPEIQVRAPNAATMRANVCASNPTGLSVSFDAGTRGFESAFMAMRGPNGWNPPAHYDPNFWGGGNGDGYTTSTEFINCGTTNQPPVAWMQYADIGRGAYQGRSYDIVDAQPTAIGGIVSGGGGNNHYKIYFNGTNWIRMA
jgi:hypothetical protein